MELRHVVTAFLQRADGRVLLGRRSDEVRTYPGRWAAISGSVETEAPVRGALREIREETGLNEDAVGLRSIGRAVRFTDWALATHWVVHPFRFRCLCPDAVQRDWEHVRFEWVEPGSIAERRSVPKLADAWQAVADHEGPPDPGRIFHDVRVDREHGAHELGIWTLDGLRAAAASATGPDEAREACRRAADLRPSMATVRSAALEVFDLVQEAGIDPKGEAIGALIGSREQAAVLAPRSAAGELPPGATVVTLSYSSMALGALHEARRWLRRLIVAESRPANEGRRTAETAASFGLETVLLTDAAAAAAVQDADVVLFGADGVLADGSVVNKTGTYALCCAAAQAGATALCVAGESKVLPAGHQPSIEQMPPEELGDPIASVSVRNPYFEQVPSELIDRIVTASGVLSAERLAERARLLSKLEESLTSGA